MKPYRFPFIKAAFLSLLFLTTGEAFADSGSTERRGCHHNGQTGGHQCNQSGNSSNRVIVPKSDDSILNENYFNSLFAEHLQGQTEVRLNYETNSEIRGYISADIVTDTYVIEGGLDKRSSLDSIQQAIFASTLIDRKPAVALYDTDGALGIYEYRIIVAAQKVGIPVFWLSEGRVTQY